MRARTVMCGDSGDRRGPAIHEREPAAATARPLDDQSGPVQVQLRVAASVAASVGLVALLLAAMGIYGVTAYTVARRTRRNRHSRRDGCSARRYRPPGARPGDVAGPRRLRDWGGARSRSQPAAHPIAVRRVAADPVAFGGAVVLFAIIGLAACYVPIRRATGINRDGGSEIRIPQSRLAACIRSVPLDTFPDAAQPNEPAHGKDQPHIISCFRTSPVIIVSQRSTELEQTFWMLPGHRVPAVKRPVAADQPPCGGITTKSRNSSNRTSRRRCHSSTEDEYHH